MSERRQDLIALSILAIVPTLLFADVLFGNSVLYLRDVTTYLHPMKTMLRSVVLGGEFPFWNPFISAGQPMAANPAHQALYPLTWLVLLPDFEFWFQVLGVVHVHIAAFSMYALLRSMKQLRPAAVFGGLSFALGGVAISLLNLWPCLFSYVWLPLTALYTRRFLHTGSRGALAAAALFLGLQLLVGEPITGLLTGIILGLYAVSHGWSRGGARGALQLVASVGLISILALLVSAAQTLPGLDHLGDSVRVRGLPWDLVRGWSMPFIRLGEIFFPHFLGVSVPDSGLPYWGAHLYDTRSTGFFFSLYGGLAVAVLATAGVVARIRGWKLFLAISVTSIVLSAGENTPLLRMLYETGIAKSWRYPEKFMMMIGFAAVVFAAAVLDRLLRGDQRVRRFAIGVAVAVTGVAGLAAIAAHLPQHGFLFATIFQTPGIPSDRLLAGSLRAWSIEVARTLLFLVILRNAGRIRQGAWLALFAVFMLFDLGPMTLELAPRLDRSFYDDPPIAARFASDRDSTRLLTYAQWEEFGAARKAQHFVKAEEHLFWVIRNGLTPMVPADLGIRTVLENDFDLTALLPTVDFTLSMLTLRERHSADWLNIALSMSNGGYISVYERPETAYAKAAGNLRALEPIRLMKGRDYPRYYFASELVSIRDRGEFVDLLLKRSYPRDIAFISAPAFQPAPGVVRSWEETANTASIDVEASGRGFLVMSVTPHKYWQVAIDGTEVEPLVTNIGYQGVVVPPGRHTVTMRYHNPLIAAGAAISLAALLALLFIARSGSHAMSSQREASDAAEPTHA